MSTVFTNAQDETVATRFFAGRATVQVEFTEFEFEGVNWDTFMVFDECGNEMSFAEAVKGCKIVWDNAHRQNENARAFETHRWSDMEMMKNAAENARARAKECARQMVRAV